MKDKIRDSLGKIAMATEVQLQALLGSRRILLLIKNVGIAQDSPETL